MDIAAIELPRWSALVFAAIAWWIQHALRRHVRLWAVLTLPATFLHELAHGVVGLLTGARPSSFNLLPRRVDSTRWRLGYVGFLRLRWWNGGAVALAPLLWALVIVALFTHLAVVPPALSLGASIAAGVIIVWTLIAIAPGLTDWTLAARCWPSAIVFLAAWGASLYTLLQ